MDEKSGPSCGRFACYTFVTVIVTGFVAFIAIGPLGRALGSGITVALTYVYDHAGFVAGLIFGGTYSLIVLTGVHHSFHAIEAGLIADIGKNYLPPIWSMANVAQGGAGLAVFFMAKKQRQKKSRFRSHFPLFLALLSPSSSESICATENRLSPR